MALKQTIKEKKGLFPPKWAWFFMGLGIGILIGGGMGCI
jgi:hypothetical protein